MLSQEELTHILQTTEEIIRVLHVQFEHEGLLGECPWWECSTLMQNVHRLQTLIPHLPATAFDAELNEALAQFKLKLSQAQKPLGREFEQVLSDNFDTLLVTEKHGKEKEDDDTCSKR